MRKTWGGFIAYFLCIAMVGCSTSQLVDSLDIVTTAATAAVDALQSAQSIPPQVTQYLTAVNNGIACTVTELQANDAAATQAARITTCFSTALAPTVPAGTPSIIASVTTAVSSALANFLKQLPSQQAIASFANSEHSQYASAMFGSTPSAKPVHLSKHDKKRLADIHKRATTNLGRIKK